MYAAERLGQQDQGHKEPGWELGDSAPHPRHEPGTDGHLQEVKPHRREQSAHWETCMEPPMQAIPSPEGCAALGL